MDLFFGTVEFGSEVWVVGILVIQSNRMEEFFIICFGNICV